MQSPLDTKSIIARNITLACYVLLILMMIITSLPSMLPEGTSPWIALL
ncbi:MAG: hypothetical protein ACJASG_001604, partial [Oleiphilaceae bacterium]